MRVLILSWEYPPLVVGGLGRHVDALSRQLAADGHDVLVVTRGESPSPVHEHRDGVRIVRSAVDPLAIDFTTESLLAWAMAAEHSLLRAALPVIRRWRPDVIHAHDWLVAQAARTLADATRAPLVVTVHATEAGRNQGWLPRPLNLAIHSVERWLTARADHVITCSTAMQAEVTRLFALPDEHVTVIPNGIDVDRWRVRRSTRATTHPLLVFAGRLVHEKGLQNLVDALPELRRHYPDLRLVVAGTGTLEDELQQRARRRRVARAIDWVGFMPEPELAALLASADAVVIPSLYEPFGLIALEAAAAGAPLVVTDTGGLSDLIAAGAVAAHCPPDDLDALTKAIRTTLDDPAGARTAARRATRVIRRDYSWPAVAQKTAQAYELTRAPARTPRPRTPRG